MGLHQASAVIISCTQKGKTEKLLSFGRVTQFYYLNYWKGILKQSLVIQLGSRGFKEFPISPKTRWVTLEKSFLLFILLLFFYQNDEEK